MDLAAELQKIYDSEINVEISWLWDGGIEVRLGDHLNGFVAETNVFLGADILPWLQEAIAHFYPDSTYCSLAVCGKRPETRYERNVLSVSSACAEPIISKPTCTATFRLRGE